MCFGYRVVEGPSASRVPLVCTLRGLEEEQEAERTVYVPKESAMPSAATTA